MITKDIAAISQRPRLMGLVSIGQSMNCRRRRKRLVPSISKPPSRWAARRSGSRRRTAPAEHARLAGPLADRTVGEVPPPQNAPRYVDPAVPRVAGPRGDREVAELSPSRNMMDSINSNVPLLLDIVSIGQAMNYRPRRTLLIVSPALFPALLDIVSTGQYRDSRTLFVSRPLRPCRVR